MGLDMFAFRGNLQTAELEEIMYWRKHNALHGWMNKVWNEMEYEEFMAGYPIPEEGQPTITRELFAEMKAGDFNCVKLPLNKERIDQLEAALENGELFPESGFFFGPTEYDPEEVYGKEDREFVRKAREALDEGDIVIYDSWW